MGYCPLSIRQARKALGAGHGAQARGACWCVGWARGALGTHDIGRAAQRGARARARHGAAQARGLGVLAGPAGCALGALSLFLTWFDSVLFLSQFLDIVREPGS